MAKCPLGTKSAPWESTLGPTQLVLLIHITFIFTRTYLETEHPKHAPIWGESAQLSLHEL